MLLYRLYNGLILEYDSSNASHGFAVTVSHEVGALAEVKRRVLTGHQRAYYITNQIGHIVWIALIQRVDGKLGKPCQFLPCGFYLSYFNHIVLY